MTKFFLGTFGAILTVLAAGFGVLSIAGGASASGDPAETTPAASDRAKAKDRTPPSELAVAIGQLTEADGIATVDLRAATRDGTDGGNFRFYSEDDGYYNGGVRSFNCDNGVITAKGGGGLTKPDGTHVAVVYQATFDTTTGEAHITVKGKGLDYTMDGTVDGLTWCGDPKVAPPTVPQA